MISSLYVLNIYLMLEVYSFSYSQIQWLFVECLLCAGATWEHRVQWEQDSLPELNLDFHSCNFPFTSDSQDLL